MGLWDVIVIFCVRDLLWVDLAAFILYVCVTRPRVRLRLIFITLVAFPLAYVLDRAAGYLWYDPRPFVVTGIAPLINYAADNGFPSDHTVLASTIAMIVTVRDWRLGTAFWFMAALIAVSRVLAGLHHPADVLGAAVIGIVSGFAGYHFIILRPMKRE